MAERHSEFLDLGARIYGLNADSPEQNSATMQRLSLPFPILSDQDRGAAITPLGFADEKDARQISKPGILIVDPDGEVVYRYQGGDYADRPDEERLLEAVAGVGSGATTQPAPALGEPRPGPKAADLGNLPANLRGARFAVLALRGRYGDLGDGFREGTTAYVEMVDRYVKALSGLVARRS